MIRYVEDRALIVEVEEGSLAQKVTSHNIIMEYNDKLFLSEWSWERGCSGWAVWRPSPLLHSWKGKYTIIFDIAVNFILWTVKTGSPDELWTQLCHGHCYCQGWSSGLIITSYTCKQPHPHPYWYKWCVFPPESPSWWFTVPADTEETAHPWH